LFTVNAYAAPTVRSPLRRASSGSFTGGFQEAQEMLDFCAERQIGADIEVINADQVNVRYRLVIDIPTIDAPVCSTTDTTGPVT
jgi:D-arabinose 1-dehydrogenase-like Zn-dependent alcohol dehydrogenase